MRLTLKDDGYKNLKKICKGIRRADVRDFSESRFEIQVRYSTGWSTVETPSPFVADIYWLAARRRWRTLRLRLLQDGRRVR